MPKLLASPSHLKRRSWDYNHNHHTVSNNPIPTITTHIINFKHSAALKPIEKNAVTIGPVNRFPFHPRYKQSSWWPKWSVDESNWGGSHMAVVAAWKKHGDSSGKKHLLSWWIHRDNQMKPHKVTSWTLSFFDKETTIYCGFSPSRLNWRNI